MEGGLCFPCDAALGADHLVAYFASAPRMRPSPTDRVSQGARRTQTALVRNTRCQRRASTSPVFNMPGHTGVGRGHRFSNMVEGRPNLETRRPPSSTRDRGSNRLQTAPISFALALTVWSGTLNLIRAPHIDRPPPWTNRAWCR